MQYIMLIHQGTTPTPRSPEEWARLSQDEQKAVYADYKAINETPGVTPRPADWTLPRPPRPSASRTGGR